MLVLGMDIGGTLSRARLATGDGATVAEAEAPSASLTAAGRERAERAVDQLLTGLRLHPPPGAAASAAPVGRQSQPLLDAICVGTAGSGSREAVEWLIGRLAPLTSTSRLIVVNDSRLALPAAGLDEGIAVIAGTGSTAVGVASGREERAGGWGHLLGDEGSGYWVAREGVRRVLRRHDSHDDLGLLGAVLLDTGVTGVTGASDPLSLLHCFHERPSPDSWARLAPLVLDCGDRASDVIAVAAAEALARLAVSVGERLLAIAPWPAGLPVVLAGGLMVNHRGLAGRTREAIKSKLPQADVIVAAEPPVAGAVRLALRAATG